VGKVADSNNDANWERNVLEKLAMEALAEQRRGRRWGIFFKLLGFGYLAVLLFFALDLGHGDKVAEGEKFTALVNLNGVIKAKGDSNAEDIISSLQAAFEDKHTAGVILRINSPGGSPVQSGIINDEMRRLRAKYPDIPLHVVVEDVCASGGYYVAVAADKIFVDKASIVGSIGVLMDGFGFTGLMDKLGVERRLITAGSNKAMLDPFSPLDPKQKELAQAMLVQIHQQFIDVVRKGRGERLKAGDEAFSGLVWNGEEAVKNGLADALGSLDYVAREIVKAEDIVDYTARENVAERLAKRFGAEVGAGAVRALRSQGAFGSADGGAPLQ
jgi:protease-4